MVYKLVKFENTDCMKLSEEFEKMTLPGHKSLMRVFYADGKPRFDVICLFDEKNDLLLKVNPL